MVKVSAAGKLHPVLGQRMSKKLIDQQKSSHRNQNSKTKATEKCEFEILNKNLMMRPATLYQIFLVNSCASKHQIKKHYHKVRILTNLDAVGDQELFKKINRACQILTNDAAHEAYKILGIDDAEKVMNNENRYLNFSSESTTFRIVRRSKKEL